MTCGQAVMKLALFAAALTASVASTPPTSASSAGAVGLPEEVRLFNKIFGRDDNADDYLTKTIQSLSSAYSRRLLSNFSEYASLYDGTDGSMRPHSLVHLHHMKTGGTSMSKLLHCACKAQPASSACSVGNLDECAFGSIERCWADEACDFYKTAPLMTACTSLYDVDKFGWDDARLVSVLRHPVDRIWSLYRYESRQTRPGSGPNCFNCVDLKDVYRMLDNGTIDELPNTTDVCKRQLSNYMTQFYSDRQLRGDDVERYSIHNTSVNDQKKMLMIALFNMWNRSSVILHTDELNSTGLRMLQHLSPELFGSSEDTAPCHFDHANASPDADACGRTLSSVPDEETKKLIIEHNALDIVLFKSALRAYSLQSKLLLNEDYTIPERPH